MLAEAGASVVCTDLNPEQAESTADECRQYGVTALGRKLDVTNAQHREDVVAEAVKELGHLNILINNAGGGDLNRLICR